MINLEKKAKKNEQVKEVRIKDYIKDGQNPNAGFVEIDEMAFFSDLRKLSGLY